MQRVARIGSTSGHHGPHDDVSSESGHDGAMPSVNQDDLLSQIIWAQTTPPIAQRLSAQVNPRKPRAADCTCSV